MNRLISVLSCLMLMLAACTSSTVDLPVAQGQPAFLFFYTDG